MTTSAVPTKQVYTGNGSITTFTIPFDFGSASEILVTFVIPATNVSTVQSSGYTISGSNVVFSVAPPTGTDVVIESQIALGQQAVFIDGSAFTAAAVNGALDTLARQIKSLSEYVKNNTVQIPTNVLTNVVASGDALVPNAVFQVDSTGTHLVVGTTGVTGPQGPQGPIGPAGSPGTGTGSMNAVSDDHSPVLGGDLSLNTHFIKAANNLGIKDDSGNAQLYFPKTGSAVNYVTIGNASTTNNPIISVLGSDSDIGITIAPRGVGVVTINGPLNTTGTLSTTSAVIEGRGTSGTAGVVKLYEKTGTGTNYIGLSAPASVTADKTFILPGTDGTAGQVLKTDGSLNLGWVTAGASGKLLQIVQTTITSATTMTSTGPLTGISSTITPTASTSKIRVTMNLNLATTSTNANTMLLTRNASGTSLIGDSASSRARCSTQVNPGLGGNVIQNITIVYLDSPATTSACTYALSTFVGDGTLYINSTATDTDTSYFGRFASNITLEEIGA